MITPQVHINIGYKEKVVFFKTYRELKKALVTLFNEYGVSSLFIVRSRRGQWGEWCERWEMDYRKEPHIVKEGWS